MGDAFSHHQYEGDMLPLGEASTKAGVAARPPLQPRRQQTNTCWLPYIPVSEMGDPSYNLNHDIDTCVIMNFELRDMRKCWIKSSEMGENGRSILGPK